MGMIQVVRQRGKEQLKNESPMQESDQSCNLCNTGRMLYP